MLNTIRHEFRHVLNDSVQNTTARLGGIQLSEKNVSLSDDVCTVHTIWEGGHRGILLLRADRSLLTRLAQTIMHMETVTPKDIEDVATEYFNIICGKVAGGLFGVAHVSSRFQVPQFYLGNYCPEEEVRCRYEFSYASSDCEGVQLVYLGLLPKS